MAWDWMHFAQATDDWWGYVNAIMQGFFNKFFKRLGGI